MRFLSPRSWPILALLCLTTPNCAWAACNTSVDLSAPLNQFDAEKVSRIEALLKFGTEYDLCFGIAYVNQSLLTRLSDFHIRDSTLIGAIESILGDELLTVTARNGVIEIRRKNSDQGTTNLFDIVIPKWETNQGPVQWISRGLHMQLVMDRNPDINGFAGHLHPGDMKDEVGPFAEHNRTIAYLLDKIVAESKGGSWIAQASWALVSRGVVSNERPAWAIIEYGGPSANYGALLRGIAAQIGPDSGASATQDGGPQP